jgi:hypothetical protein
MIKTTSFSVILFSLVFLFSVACNQQKNSREEGSASNSEAGSMTDVPAGKNERALAYHEKLMESFSPNWMELESNPDIYPDYYGGSYIDNNGTFVVAVTGNQEQNKQKLAKILGGDDFNVETVQYSYKQLFLVMDKIDAFLENTSIPEEHPVLLHFAGAYPDVIDNRVKVILTEVTETVTGAFKKDVVNSPMVVFEKGEIPTLM